MNTPDASWMPALLRAGGFTLLHSLWQGTALGLLLALLLRLLGGQAALVRYRLAALALAVLAGLSAFTFGEYYGVFSWSTGASAARVLSATALGQLPPAAGLAALPERSWPAGLALAARFMEQHLATLAVLWLLGFGVMAGRLLLSWVYVRQLRRTRLSAVPAAWQQRLAQLVRRAGLRRNVQLVVSARVPSPAVIGYWKPLILLPLGLLGELSPAAMEMLLAHELAHVMRRDYVFNVLQAIAEAIFFYHPAVWYMAAVLHAERENCCDDLATELGGNPRALAQALATLAERALAAPALPQLCLAASGTPGSVLHRVRRLTGARPAATAGLWPAGLALLGTLCLLGGLAGPARLAPARPARSGVLAVATRTTHSQPDDAPRTGRPALAATDAALRATFQARLLADGLMPDTSRYALLLTATHLLVNGQPQPAAVLARYRQLYEAATGCRVTATTSYRTERVVLIGPCWPNAKAPGNAPARGRAWLLAPGAPTRCGPGGGLGAVSRFVYSLHRIKNEELKI